LAGAALVFDLTGDTEESTEWAWFLLLGLLVNHITPHITCAALAEVDLRLDGGLQGLHIVEHERERDQTGRHGDGREDDGREGNSLQRSLLFLIIEALVHDD
jgi:hypothetical protein